MSFDYEYNGTNLRSSGETWEEKQIERLERRVAALTAERDDWRDRCTEAQAERDAAREERDELKRRLYAVVDAVEQDARVETTALVQAVRAIAEGRDDE